MCSGQSGWRDHSTDLLYFIAFDHVGCFSFNQCVGRIQLTDTKDMFSKSKNVLEKSVSFLAWVWGLPIKIGQEWTKESEADQQAIFEGHEVSKQREEFI